MLEICDFMIERRASSGNRLKNRQSLVISKARQNHELGMLTSTNGTVDVFVQCYSRTNLLPCWDCEIFWIALHDIGKLSRTTNQKQGKVNV